MLSITNPPRKRSADENSPAGDDNDAITAGIQEQEQEQTEKSKETFFFFDQRDIWIRHILPFLGPGNYIFVAGVNKCLKQYYSDYFASIEIDKLPDVQTPYPEKFDYILDEKSTLVLNTFSSLSCAQYWFSTSQEHILELDRAGFIEFAHQMTIIMAAVGNVQVLTWALGKNFSISEHTSAAAAKAGHLDVLKLLHLHGCRLDCHMCENAARYGHLEILKWARKHGCPWDYKTCSWALHGGHLEILKWAKEHGCPWNEAI